MPISDKRAAHRFRNKLGGSCLPIANVRSRKAKLRCRQCAEHIRVHLPQLANSIYWKYSLVKTWKHDRIWVSVERRKAKWNPVDNQLACFLGFAVFFTAPSSHFIFFQFLRVNCMDLCQKDRQTDRQKCQFTSTYSLIVFLFLIFRYFPSWKHARV